MRHFSGEFEGIRVLMADELDLISGGDGEDTDDVQPERPDLAAESDIVVNGKRYKQGVEVPLDWILDFGPPPPPDDYNHWLEQQCQTDLQTDMLARQIENLIKAKTDWNSREYGAVIYEVNGEIKMGPVTRGMTVAEAAAAGLPAPETRISLPSDLGSGQIIAVVHSHPDVGYSNSADLDNRYPSNYANGGDYYFFDKVVGSDPRFANAAAFSQYILGPDGVLREFNASEGRVSRNNDTNPDRSQLNYDRPCYN